MGPPAGRAGALLKGPRRSALGEDAKLLGVLSDKDSWDYATALFNSANQLRDRGDYEGAAAKIRRGLKEVIEGDALLALVRELEAGGVGSVAITPATAAAM